MSKTEESTETESSHSRCWEVEVGRWKMTVHGPWWGTESVSFRVDENILELEHGAVSHLCEYNNH